MGEGNRGGGFEGVHVEGLVVVVFFFFVGTEWFAAQREAQGWPHDNEDVARVVARRGAEAEVAEDFAVDDGRDEGQGVMVRAKQREPEEVVLDVVVVAALADADEGVVEEVLCHERGFGVRGRVVDEWEGASEGGEVREEGLVDLWTGGSECVSWFGNYLARMK